MAVNTSVRIEIDSTRMGRTYRVARFTEYNVDMDLETDADAFDFVLKNPNGIYTALFGKFDNCRLYVNDTLIMRANIDKVEYIIIDNDNYIQISGRDLCWKLVDNDALPDTLNSVNPVDYIGGKCSEYGIGYSSTMGADIYDKLVIGCGESEISIMNNILLDSRQRIWYVVDVLYTGSWSTRKSPSHVFVHTTTESGIPVETLRLSEDGTQMRSEVCVYGNNSNSDLVLVGSSKNDYMRRRGITKRQVSRSYSDNASSKYTSIAGKDIRKTFQDNIELILEVRNHNSVFFPNTTAQVICGTLNMSALFFIKKVQYTQTIKGGTVAKLTMIPADTTFENTWQSDGNSVTNPTSASSNL